ncbi:unnamed protein product [Timema podura]|uniref:Fatty acid synthase pseudo-KR domain-containing protein n=1 Tax=Timema podura TaxID=61482 RepID=A0ABN7NY41_TIMPD|nr:unnamed protein product [Timema podura]
MWYTHIVQTQPLHTTLTRTPLIYVRMSPLHALTVLSPSQQQAVLPTSHNKFRYIFILDKNAPKFSLNKDFYRQQLIQDLLVNFYENGSWGSFRQLPIDELREFSPQNGLLPELR